MNPRRAFGFSPIFWISAALILAVAGRAQAPADPGAAAPEPPAAVKAWQQSPAAAEFRAKHEKFLRKTNADSHLDFTMPRTGIALIFIPPGRFQMGDDSGEDDERPETVATVTRGFWLGKYELTQQEWGEVMQTKPSHNKGPHLPLENASWKAVTLFCQRLTEQERDAGRLPRGYVYRLPTEAEWEYACRLGLDGSATGITSDTGWYAANANQTTHPVGLKQPNALGMYDMLGNVAEWCLDWFGKYPHHALTDYAGPPDGDYHVARGGRMFDIAYGCRPSYRTGAEPNVKSGAIGMRLALAPSIE